MYDKTKFNNQSLGEEISNAVSHGVGALLAIAATVLVIIRACIYSDAMGIVGATLYGASLIILYTSSTMYHSLTNYTAKKVFQIFDHCTIFLLIVGTEIPLAFTVLRGKTGWIIFGINAFCMIVGIALNAINMNKYSKPSLVLYVLMGWSIVLAGKNVINLIPRAGLVLLVLGGLFYTCGLIFYSNKKLKYMHFVWHLFVLAGSILHFFVIFFYCYK